MAWGQKPLEPNNKNNNDFVANLAVATSFWPSTKFHTGSVRGLEPQSVVDGPTGINPPFFRRWTLEQEPIQVVLLVKLYAQSV